MNCIEDVMRAEAQAYGLDLPPDLTPGKLNRFPGAGKSSSNTAGWCRIFEDQRGGVFGDFSCDLRVNVQLKRDTAMTQAEREDFARRCRESREKAEADERQQRERTAQSIEQLMPQSEPAETHEYLARKGIKPYRLRVFTGRLTLREMECHGALMAALLDANRKPAALQFIDASGEKRFLGSTRGLYYPIGKPESGQPLLICEGISTGHSLHECTGYAVACAMNAGNLESVARLMREREPDRKIIIAADHDYRTKDPRTGEPKNVGVMAAQTAARAVGGFIALPDFGNDRAEGDTDFNDMAQRKGMEAVKGCIERAQPAAPADVAPVAGIAESQEWEEPEPIGRNDKAEPYPLDAWPGIVGEAIREVIHSAQVPPALAAHGALCAMSTAAMGLADVKRAETLVGPIGIFALVLCESGERKSHVDRLFMRGIEEWQSENVEEHRQAYRRYLTEKEVWENKRKGLLDRIKRLSEHGPKQETKGVAK